jgi:hypothetical protein
MLGVAGKQVPATVGSYASSRSSSCTESEPAPTVLQSPGKGGVRHPPRLADGSRPLLKSRSRRPARLLLSQCGSQRPRRWAPRTAPGRRLAFHRTRNPGGGLSLRPCLLIVQSRASDLVSETGACGEERSSVAAVSSKTPVLIQTRSRAVTDPRSLAVAASWEGFARRLGIRAPALDVRAVLLAVFDRGSGEPAGQPLSHACEKRPDLALHGEPGV